MYCKNCGKEIGNDAAFCPDCGADQQNAEYQSTYTATAAPEVTADVVQEKKPAKVWSVFSIVGKVFGIVAMCLCWVPEWPIILAIPGIVFSCLGKKANTPEAQKNFKVGLTLSIVAIGVAFLINVVLVILAVALELFAYSGAWLSIIGVIGTIIESLQNLG